MASRLSKVFAMDMDMATDHSEYSYPITNITYHLPDSPHLERGEAAAQKAFQRILDSYDENERLADAFQVELDKRTQTTNERKAEERRIRAERQRLAREERRNKKQGKNSSNKTVTASSTPTTTTATTTPPPGGPTITSTGLSVAALAQAFQPRHGRFAAAGYSLVGLEQRRLSVGHNNAVSCSGRSRQSSVGSLHSCSCSNTTNTSAHEGEVRMVDSRLSLSASDHSHSPPLPDVHGHHHSSSNPEDRSLSSSPILPLTPSPRITPSDTAFGVVNSLPSTLAVTTTAVFPTSSTMTAPLPSASSASSLPNTSSTFPSTNNDNNNNSSSNNNSTSLPTPPPQQHSGSSTLPMRNKRKQAIPVHPSVIKRIPGITFRIQPDLDKHLQVEILKNIEDYQSTAIKDVSLPGGHSTSLSANMSQRLQQLDDASPLQTNMDLNKVRQSITSSRPGYASLYIPDDSTSYDDPYLQDYRETSPHTMALHAAPNQSNKNTRYHPYQQHSRNGSLGSVHSVSIQTSTDLRSRSSSSANIWAPYAPSTAGLAMLLSDVVAARATLPLSWDNFSTRDCQVNKVVGKNGQDFEQLEAVVQETVARHQAVAAAAQQKADEENQEDGEGTDELAEQNSSTAAKESLGPSGDASRKRKSVPAITPPSSITAPPSQASAQPATGSRATRSRATHHTERGRSSRAGATDLVEGYDDIERILKEKRQKKREQQKHRDSQSRGVSEATTEGDYDMDINMKDPRIKEDDGLDDRSALLREYSESEQEGSTMTHSKRGAAKPHTPPHSRQVTPAAKVDFGSSSLHPHAHLGSNLSRTPPATPTRASMRHPQHTESTHQEPSAESTAAPVSKTRARARSFSTTILTDAKTNFFESALEMIEAKRRQSIAKKKASAIANSVTAAVTPGATNTDSPQDDHQQQVDEQQQQANRELERELASETSQKMMAPNSNIPKSSKFLPGRVLRKPRVKNYDDSDVETDHHDGGSKSGSATSSAGSEVTYDRDCSSCRLDVTYVDRELWKQACQSGEIYVNPKTWGRTAILCSSCRTQYLRHGLRCTQCFYVPVWNPEPAPVSAPETIESSSSSVPSVGNTSVMPKPGGTCKRCKAGTWFHEV